MVDGKDEAKKTWGASPTGWTSAQGHTPGTDEFFEKARQFRDSEEQPWLQDVVPFHSMSGKDVLEIGFGPGYDALKFLENGAKYQGIDITPENVERTKRHLARFGLNPDVRQGDAEYLPFSDGEFDVVYSNGVLHHVPDIAKSFREAHRVLKGGGTFYVILYHKHSVFYLLTVAGLHFLTGGFLRESLAQRRSRIEFSTAEAAPIVNVYSRAELRRLLDSTGFETNRILIRKCTWADLPAAGKLGRMYRTVPKSVYSAVGHVAGWYVIAEATKIQR